MGFQTYTAVLLSAFGISAWALPEQTAIDQQLASVKLQRESVQKQMVAIRKTSPKPLLITSAPAPIAMPITALQPVAISVAMPLWAAPQMDCPPIEEAEAEELINAAAAKQTLSPALLRSVIKHESAFRPCAISVKGAQGLMQLMPSTAEQFGVIDPFDPKQNIRGGAAFLRQLLNRYGGDLKLALSAYNAGAGRVEASGGVPDLLETQSYVGSILGDLGINEEPSIPETNPPN
ncbi:MAG: lytic transglycosylase domain-containing protein [Acidobacteriaceae bacterium]|nr:lytic transglycosylase domain-containing protein [Acidobacteriaceae bacterium]